MDIVELSEVFIAALVSLSNEMAIYILFGLFFAGILHELVPSSIVEKKASVSLHSNSISFSSSGPSPKQTGCCTAESHIEEKPAFSLLSALNYGFSSLVMWAMLIYFWIKSYLKQGGHYDIEH